MQFVGVFLLGFYACLMHVLFKIVFTFVDNISICHTNSTVLDAGVGGGVYCILFSFWVL